MEVTVSGRKIEVTEPIRDYATSKVAKLPRYYDRIQSIEVIIDKQDHHAYKVEMIVKVEHHDPFVATRQGDDMYGCIDDAVNKLERQLTDHKEKRRNRKHNV